MVLLTILFFLPLLASAKSWHSFWYDLGLFGIHPTVSYESFDLQAPELNVIKSDPRCEDGHILLTPRGMFYPEPGPLIFDNAGNLVWMENKYGMVMDLKVQHYKGRDYLTFWAGEDDGTRGNGQYYMLDSSYEVAHIITAANGLMGDLHEFKLTENGTALMTIYEMTPADLTSVGGPSDGWIYDGVFQEVDLETGEVVFQWRARDHYAVDEAYSPLGDKGREPTKASAWDYFHINSVDKDAEGNYLVSSRYMHTLTCVKPSGDLCWVLGGKRNMFQDLSEDGSATGFSWQHHARWHPDNIVTVFDNGADEDEITTDHSRGLMISLDLDAMTATTLQVFNPPDGWLSRSQGSVQVMPDTGNVFVGWGRTPAWTEFTADGEVLCDVHFSPRWFFRLGWVKSYRTEKAKWVGTPSYPPTFQLEDGGDRLYVSWNGATEVAGWVLQGSGDPHAQDADFETLDYIPKTGFETCFDLPQTAHPYLRVAAVGFDGKDLGYTNVFETDPEYSPSSSSSSFLLFSDMYLPELLLSSLALAGVFIAIWKSRQLFPSFALVSRWFTRHNTRF
ncbi:hypothetical protein ASPZODRAFT_138978 [Penicilliopsis zonata CBS 506.65]|uniref:ASST-domain-containing protein n=1 Tax=Penicilliopsis zonata CBS 506.65 TaxID=1073090 RepID=A0A1L9SR50_9EURO|nr:hypothetical protein ASPZODRAFT_138978 [Penicilliopsis zonata CBS 506.65]OJJ49593.1 hypothetical protein ASPZODRAFT_138978 [Penicilliopsis zonata CBS 506.65]